MLSSVEPFDPDSHRRDDFRSGLAAVDNFLKLTARKLAGAHATAVFVVVDQDHSIIGYYALSSITIDTSDIGASKDSKLFDRFNVIPATLLSFLGVDRRWQGRGVGRLLLADALRRSLSASRQVGSYCLVLDVFDDGDQVTTERRQAYYEGFGFRHSDTDKAIRMFLTMQDIKKNMG